MREDFTITKEQIIELALKSDKASIWLQQNFKDAFKKTLEVGKWYKCIEKGFESLIVITDLEGSKAYGFSYYGENDRNIWNNESNCGWSFKSDTKNWIEATESEVYEALKNEALKRGFVEGVYFLGSAGNLKNTPVRLGGFKYACNTSGFSDCNIGLYYSDSWIFNAGKWATLVKTKTKQEAEKELNCKIID